MIYHGEDATAYIGLKISGLLTCSRDSVFLTFVFHRKSICCVYLLDVPLRGVSDGYSKHMFLRN